MSIQFWLLLHFAATVFMTGLIWFVQVVHYPLMAAVGPEQFRDYSRWHQSLTSWVVGPAMLVEVGTLALLLPLVNSPVGVELLLSLLLLVTIWLSTAFLQVPIHRALLEGLDKSQVRQLVQSNWCRTIAWTGRCLLIGKVCLTLWTPTGPTPTL